VETVSVTGGRTTVMRGILVMELILVLELFLAVGLVFELLVGGISLAATHATRAITREEENFILTFKIQRND
jgi:hypothetical protein